MEVMMKKKILLAVITAAVLLGGCGSQSGMKDGFYTAETAEYSHGWKEYVCIMVKDNAIVSVEFNAKNPSGYIKAWDNAYMQNMSTVSGTYPNEYTRLYGAQLLAEQGDFQLDAVSGASHSGHNFEKLAAAVMAQARKGDSTTVQVATE